MKYEAIRRGDGEIILHRWILWDGRWKVYLHHFVASDHGDLHDHPKKFITIGLWGGYGELVPDIYPCGGHHFELYNAPWIRWFPATHRHLVQLVEPPFHCWTLAIVGGKTREWGFWKNNVWRPWWEGR